MNINKYLLLSIIVAASAGFLFGFDTGNIAGALVFIARDFHASALQSEWIVSITIFAAFLGAVFSGKAVDVYGRKSLLIFSGFLYVIGTVFCTVSQSIVDLVMARFILGLAIGVSSYTAPLYISEIAPAQFRGFFVLLNGVAITSGEAIAYGLDYHFSFNQDWRNMFLVGIIPAIIFCIGTRFMPCSPRWLVTKGKTREAKKILLKFYKPAKAENELLEIQKPSIQSENLISIIKNKSYKRLLFIGISLGIFQQFFGINVVMYYGPFIFEKAGFHSASSDILLTFYLGVVNTVLTIITGLIIDRFGRRKLLMIGSVIAGCSLFTLSALFHIGIHYPWQGMMMMICMVTFIIGYCISVGSLFWLIISEIFPLSIRGQAMSIATATQWLANFAVSLSFLSLLNTIGPSITFSMYASVCCMAVIFTYFYVPETKRSTLEDIEIGNLSNTYSFGNQTVA